MPPLNNFNLLRLGAALIVLVSHLGAYNLLPGQWHMYIYKSLPGVPIFFLISGFLISGSWLNKPHWHSYARARVLRIYPAFVAATAVLCAALLLAGYTPTLGWVLGQLSIFGVQATPDALKGFAAPLSGMPNAALWTIPVEVAFYLLLPVMLYKRSSLLIGAFMLASLLYFMVHPTSHQLAGTLWMFCIGILVRLEWTRLESWFAGKFGGWLLLHAAAVLLLPHAHLLPPNAVLLVLTLTLAGLVFAAAFTAPRLSGKLIGSTDISYGVYLYQFPLIHLAVLFGFSGWLASASITMAVCGLAWLSWHLLEQPLLRRK